MFIAQLKILSKVIVKNCFILGDFNLDVRMELRPDYAYKIPFAHLTDFVTINNLFQLVDFTTWTRNISGTQKESILDHVYTNNLPLVNDITFEVPTFGDYFLVIAELVFSLEDNKESMLKCNWNKYSKVNLIQNLTIESTFN